MALVAVLLPALLMPLLLWLAPAGWALPPLRPDQWPPAIWGTALAGGAATVAGALDWRFHRNGGRRVPRAEHRAEVAALSLGAPLLVLLTTLAVDRGPQRHWWLAPIAVVIAGMAALIRYDERRFHRRCGRYETTLHRVLVGGHAAATACWLCWCLDLGAGDA